MIVDLSAPPRAIKQKHDGILAARPQIEKSRPRAATAWVPCSAAGSIGGAAVRTGRVILVAGRRRDKQGELC